jgi:hypothetical protein
MEHTRARPPYLPSSPLQKAWPTLFEWGKSEEGRAAIARAMRICTDSLPESKEDVDDLADWASSAWDYMAMGDYPYPSGCVGLPAARADTSAEQARAACCRCCYAAAAAAAVSVWGWRTCAHCACVRQPSFKGQGWPVQQAAHVTDPASAGLPSHGPVAAT